MTILRTSLIGGLKERKAKLKQGSQIGFGESIVFNNTLTIRKGERTRKVKLAERVFPRQPDKALSQFLLISELARLNRINKLSLQLPITIRLGNKNGKKRILMTKFYTIPEINFKHFMTKAESEAIRREFAQDRAIQLQKAEENGFILPIDAFVPARNKSEKVFAAIVKFEGIKRIKQ